MNQSEGRLHFYVVYMFDICKRKDARSKITKCIRAEYFPSRACQIRQLAAKKLKLDMLSALISSKLAFCSHMLVRGHSYEAHHCTYEYKNVVQVQCAHTRTSSVLSGAFGAINRVARGTSCAHGSTRIAV